MNQSKLISIQAGLPQVYTNKADIGPAESTWTTAFSKQPVKGPIWLGNSGLAGDGQANTKNHGGVEKAVCVYPAEHYAYWQEALNLSDLIYGAFAENFTTQGLLEDNVCIGDMFSCGEAVLQVSQPRPPCWKLSRWWQVKDFAARLEQTGRTGWYLRVTKEGYVEPGGSIELVKRSYPFWSIAIANQLALGTKEDLSRMKELATCSSLSNSWREAFLSKINKLESQ